MISGSGTSLITGNGIHVKTKVIHLPEQGSEHQKYLHFIDVVTIIFHAYFYQVCISGFGILFCISSY